MTAAFSPGGRLIGIDIARCVALLSMFVAHTAPSPGPAGVLNLTEFLTVALFALLVGVSADLSADRMTFSALFAGSVVRALALIFLGLWSDTWGAQVDNVLPYLGVLSLFAALLVYLPTAVLAVLALLFWWFTPWAITAFDELHVQLYQSGSWMHYLTLWMFEGSSYRVFTMLGWACAGIVLIRLMHRWGAAGDIAGALVFTLAAGSTWWYASQQFEFFPYTGNRWEVGFDMLLAVATVCWCSLLARIFSSRPSALEPLAVTGRMTLTLYLAQLALLAGYVKLAQEKSWGGTDDSWWVMAGLIIFALVFANLWHRLLGGTFAARGPVETVLGWVSGRR